MSGEACGEARSDACGEACGEARSEACSEACGEARSEAYRRQISRVKQRFPEEIFGLEEEVLAYDCSKAETD